MAIKTWQIWSSLSEDSVFIPEGQNKEALYLLTHTVDDEPMTLVHTFEWDAEDPKAGLAYARNWLDQPRRKPLWQRIRQRLYRPWWLYWSAWGVCSLVPDDRFWGVRRDYYDGPIVAFGFWLFHVYVGAAFIKRR